MSSARARRPSICLIYLLTEDDDGAVIGRPKGYTTAPDSARAYTSHAENLPSANVWFNLACACGQQYAYERGSLDPDVLQALRDEALHALEQAVALQPDVRARARGIIQGQAGPDDDLVTIAKDDPRFLALVRDAS